MEGKRRFADEGVICIRTCARCTDKKLGALVGDYCRHELSPEQKSAFEGHLSECIACDSTVLNWQSLKFAAARIRSASKGSTDDVPKAGK
jgi:anti-sigma factor RsiW